MVHRASRMGEGACSAERKRSRRSSAAVLLPRGAGQRRGIGGWAFKDHPAVKAILTLVAGDASKNNPSDVEKSLSDDVAGLLKKGPDFTPAGCLSSHHQQGRAGPGALQAGHTVDIQAKVTKRDAAGQDAVVWDSRNYGERLAVGGKGLAHRGWPNRPFQVDWSPGEVLFLEVYDRKNAFFAAPKRFTLSSRTARRFSAQDG